MLVTGSWDKTLRYWDVRTAGQPKATVQLPERCYSMDVKQNMIVVATAERFIVIYDFRKPQEPMKVRFVSIVVHMLLLSLSWRLSIDISVISVYLMFALLFTLCFRRSIPCSSFR